MQIPGIFARASALACSLLLAGQAASARDLAWTESNFHQAAPLPVSADRSPFAQQALSWIGPRPTPVHFAFNPTFNGPAAVHGPMADGSARPVAWRVPIGPNFGTPPTLSAAASRVSQIAARNGDRDYLMVDKVNARLILFTNGVPVFTDRVLTGTSLADRLPPDALNKTYAEQNGVKYRVTPAGRFTVSQTYDDQYGMLLDINEIKGKDWALAIHRAPSARRVAWLRSQQDLDTHVTEGCINVDPVTMRQLTQLLPRRGSTPVYILPNDESLITELF